MMFSSSMLTAYTSEILFGVAGGILLIVIIIGVLVYRFVDMIIYLE